MTIHLLIGPTAAGKSTALRHLESKGMLTIESSAYCKPICERYKARNFIEAVERCGRASIGYEIAMQIEDHLHARAAEQGKRLSDMDAAISGFRIPWQLDYFQGRFGSQVQLIGLYAPPQTCFERHHRPGRPQHATVDEFIEHVLLPDYHVLGMGEVFDMVPRDRWVITDKGEEHMLRGIDELTAR